METGGGSALDWFYHELKVSYAYQIKLRDTGSYGFLLPSKNIVPTGREAFRLVQYFGEYLLGDKGIERSEPGVNEAAEISKPEKVEEKVEAEWVMVDEEVEEDGEEQDGTANFELRRRRRR